MKKLGMLLLVLFSMIMGTGGAYDSDDTLMVSFYTIVEEPTLAIRCGKERLLEGKIYRENENFMVPLTAVINIENVKHSGREQAVYKKDGTTATVWLDGAKAVFQEGNRNVTLRGNKRGLYCVPRITEEDVFVAVSDLYLLLNLNEIQWEKDAIEWYFMRESGAYWKDYEDSLKEYTFSVELGGVLQKHPTDKTISAYEKNGQLMIALTDVQYFVGIKSCIEWMWHPENRTLDVKTWRGAAHDVVFQENSNVMLVDGVAVPMDASAEIKYDPMFLTDRLYVPITAVFQMLEIPESHITWIEKGKKVTVQY